MPTMPWLFAAPLGWYSSKALMSLKSVPSGFKDSPSLREFKISLTFPRNAPTFTKRWLPTTMGRFRSFCFFRASFSRLSRMCFGKVLSVCWSVSPKHSSPFSFAPPISISTPSRSFKSPSKGGQTTKHWPLSFTSLTCQGATLSGNFSANFSLICIQLCSAGMLLKARMAPPSCACTEFFFWWCCGLASNFGSGALPGRRIAEPSSFISNFDAFKAAMTSSLVARMAFILLQLRTRLISSQPSAFDEIFSLKNLSCFRLSSLR
mmetsp:Transcript_97821/g.281453  ORF Transcript_97821/g.281453 Transcript_97821/m.281453 type:complete len:263 (+) Transcript_97821:347-1135(+)